MSPVLRVSTHIYGVTKEIDGKMFILTAHTRHVTPQINLLGKMNPVLMNPPGQSSIEALHTVTLYIYI